MTNVTALLLVLWVAVSVGICWGWEDTMEKANQRANLPAADANVKAEDAKQSAAETVQDAKEKSQSWADWVSDKFSEGFVSNQDARDGAQNMMNKAEDAASKATETMNSAASESSKFASQKAGDVKNFASEKAVQGIRMATDKGGEAKETMSGAMSYGKNKAANAYDEAKQKMYTAKDMASDAKETIAGAMGHGKNKAAESYDEAKHKVGEAYMSAKETMTEQGKVNYEAAKEKASQAAGDLGARMREDTAEL